MDLQKKKGRTCVRPLFALLGLGVFSYFLYHSLAGGTLLAHSPYDSYSLMAENWLAGHLDLPDGASRDWLELAVYEGNYYISFPPVPAVFQLPWVLVCGGAAAVPSHLIQALYGLLGLAGVYCLFARRRFAAPDCLFWAVLSVAGSNLYWMTTDGGVWFQAQALCFALLVWGLYFAFGTGTGPHTLAAFLLALAVGCRPFTILYLAVYLGLLFFRQSRTGRKKLRMPGAGFWLPFAAAALVGAALAAFNWVRFGNIFEFGHNYLPEFAVETDGQFRLAYLVPNLLSLLRPVTLTAAGDLNFPRFNGFAFFLANPIFLLWAVRMGQRIWRRSFSKWEGGMLACFAVSVVLLCLHRTLGGWQFGARYLVDCIPWVLLSEVQLPAKARRHLSGGAWTLCAAAVLFNAYGAVYMLTH